MTDAARRWSRAGAPLVWLLLLAAIVVSVAFMLVGLRGNLLFSLQLRGIRLLALVQVGTAVAIATVLLQTITRNRILTPSVMGMDALYLLVQSLLVAVLGGIGFSGLSPQLKFAGEALLMIGLAAGLFLPLLSRRADLGLLLLMGVVLGLLFRALTNLAERLLDPNDFAVLQSVSFANFNAVQSELLGVGTAVTVLGAVLAWRARHVLDILALGRDASIGLGIAWQFHVLGLLIIVAALTAVSTALVGPIAFLGLLVAALGERLAQTRRHTLLLPATVLVAVIALVGGQLLFQHLLGGAATLGVAIEFVGGTVFLLMLLKGARR